MALTMDYDYNNGISLKGMYFRIDKISFNDTHFQVVATGYASEEAFRSGKLPISEPRAYTLENYNKQDIEAVFQFGYEVLKQHDVFKEAKDSLTEPQKKRTGEVKLNKTKIESTPGGVRMKGSPVSRFKKGLEN